jgi:hypothetical protein
MDETQNPTRRYKHFRPRQATFGQRATGTPTNLATVSLFNNSPGPQALMVRDVNLSSTAGDLIRAAYVPGAVGTTSGIVSQMIPTDGLQAGFLASIDTATVFNGFYIVTAVQGAFTWYHDFPFAIVPVGFSLVFQNTTAAHAMSVALIWETVAEDQIDFSYPLWLN